MVTERLAHRAAARADWRSAARLFQRAAGLWHDRTRKALALRWFAWSDRQLGLLANAASTYQQALDLSKQPPPDQEGTAKSLRGLATVAHDLARFREETDYLTRAVAILESTEGKDSAAVADLLQELVTAYQELGDGGKARAILERAADIVVVTAGRESVAYAKVLGLMGLIETDFGSPTKAIELFNESQRLVERLQPDARDDLAVVINGLGNAYACLGQIEEARACYRRVIELREATYGPDDWRLAIAVNNLANLEKQERAWEDAERLYLRALSLAKSQGSNHPRVGVIATNLASLYVATGQPDKARGFNETALLISRSAEGQQPPIAVVLEVSADIEEAEGHFDKALTLRQSALERMEQTLSEDDPQIGWLLNRLARTQDLGGDQQAAEASLDRALVLADRDSRPAAFLRAETLTNQARLMERFEPDRAVGIYETACELYRRLAPDALKFADCLADLGRLLRWLDRRVEAKEAESQANVIYAKHAWAQSRRSLKAFDR